MLRTEPKELKRMEVTMITFEIQEQTTKRKQMEQLELISKADCVVLKQNAF